MVLFKNLSLFFSVVVVLSNFTYAKIFTSHYCQFELPAKWECALEGTEWVCQSVVEDRKREAIIILAAKIRGKQDSLEQYQAYLKKSKTFNLPGNKTQVSDPKFTKLVTVNQHRWIDSLHLASEVPGFYTRYMATVKEDLGVVVTFSVAKDHYDSYKDVFGRIIQTLKVFRQKAVDPSQYKLAGGPGGDDLVTDAQFIPDTSAKHGIGNTSRGQIGAIGMGTGTSILLLIAIVIGAFILLRKMRKKKR